MADIVYNQRVYSKVVKQKQDNEEYINDLYSSYSSFSFNDKLIAMEIIDELKKLNYEYEKYIIVYEQTSKNNNLRNEYVVIEGDTLVRIAQKTLGDYKRWQDIYNYNNLKDLYLSPGDTIKIPEV